MNLFLIPLTAVLLHASPGKKIPQQAFSAWSDYSGKLTAVEWQEQIVSVEKIYAPKKKNSIKRLRESRTVHRIAICSHGWLCRFFDEEKEEVSGRLYCSNSKYGFRIDKSNKGWKLTQTFISEDDSELDARRIISVRDSVRRRVFCLVTIFGFRLDEIASGLEQADPQMNRSEGGITYQSTGELSIGTGSDKKSFSKLSVTLDPKSFWVLKSARAISKGPSGGWVEIAIQYRTSDVQGLPIPSEIIHTVDMYRSDGVKWATTREESTIECKLAPEIDPEQFRLSHYGLPEPANVEWSAPTPWYVWILVAAGIVGIVSLLLKRFAKSVNRRSS